MHAHADELKDPAAKSTCRLDLALCRTLSSDRTTEGVDVLELNVMKRSNTSKLTTHGKTSRPGVHINSCQVEILDQLLLRY